MMKESEGAPPSLVWGELSGTTQGATYLKAYATESVIKFL